MLVEVANICSSRHKYDDYERTYQAPAPFFGIVAEPFYFPCP